MAKISVFQTIQTKYISPSNYRGSRIKAKTASGMSIVRGYNHSLNADQNHAAVAEELQVKMHWSSERYGDLIGGQNADGSYTWIMMGTIQ